MMVLKKYSVWIALVLTMIATVWLAQQEESDVVAGEIVSTAPPVTHIKQTIITKNKPEPVAENKPMLADLFLQRVVMEEEPQNIFSAFLTVNNHPERDAAPAITLPTNPFVYVGKIVEDGAIVVFLIDGEKSHAVKSGDLIEDTWKIMSITPPTITLRYMPLKVNLQMDIGANS